MSRPRSLESSPRQDALRTSVAVHENRAISGTRRAVGFGKYRLFARLGSGGMADVYLAVAHGTMNDTRLVVIKRLRDEHANDAATRGMFLDEARLAARLNHPNVIQTFEAGNENGSFFLAMEYVDGQPLSRILTTLRRQGKILEPRLAARICSDALNGLHYAHELADFDGSPLEIVHRDVSPQNVMLTYEGAVKLVDFGIAKAAGTTETAHGVFKGKVAFMAPEQVRAENVDRRADLFAAGIVLWESVTGRHLMAESTPAATLYNLMTKEIPRASEVNPNVPAELDDIIERALRRDVSERYQTAKEMRDDLEAFIVSSGGVRHEELGEIAKTLFADTREKVQAQIRSQLATLSLGRTESHQQRPSSGQPTNHELGETQIRQTTPTNIARLVSLDDGFVEASSKASVFRVVTTANPTPAPARRLALAAWFFVPLLALAASGLALWRAPHATTVEPLTAPPPPPPATLASTAPTAPTAPVISASTPATTSAPSAPEMASASASASTAPRATTTTTTAPPPPRPIWIAPPPRPPAAPAPPQAPTAGPATEAPRPAAPSTTPAKTQDPPQGRTFRRDL
jgi:serine/threonine-protein kinase